VTNGGAEGAGLLIVASARRFLAAWRWAELRAARRQSLAGPVELVGRVEARQTGAARLAWSCPQERYLTIDKLNLK